MGLESPSRCMVTRLPGWCLFWTKRGSRIAIYVACDAGSLRLDTGKLDDFCPFLGVFGDELPKIGRGECKHRGAEVGKPRLHLGIGEPRIDLLIELLDDFGGRI